MKKLISLLLSFLMVFAILPFGILNVSAADTGIQERIDALVKEYPTGSYFTTTGEAFHYSGCNFESPTCPDRFTAIDAKGALPSGKMISNLIKNYNAHSCNGFATYCFGYIFGQNWQEAVEVAGREIPFSQLGNHAMLGDFVQINYKSNPALEHCFIYLYQDDENYYVYDSNYNENNMVEYERQVPKNKAYNLLTVRRGWDYDTVNKTGKIFNKYDEITEGTYFIKNKATGKYLHVDGGIDNDSQNVIVYDKCDSTADNMKIRSTGVTKVYTIQPTCSETRIINASSDYISDGVDVNLYQDMGGDVTQCWYFKKTTGGYFIHNVRNDKCVLTVQEDGNVNVQYYNGSDSQIWTLEDVNSQNTNPTPTPSTPDPSKVEKIDFQIALQPYVQQYSTSLNDGRASGIDTLYNYGEWFGIRKGYNTNSDGYVEIILDLGAVYDLSKVQINFANENDAGISNPWSVSIAVSDSQYGNYAYYDEYFSVIYSPDVAEGRDPSTVQDHVTYWSKLENIAGMAGRYVKIYFWVGGSWAFLNEIEVYGAKTDKSTSPLAFVSGAVDGAFLNADIIDTALSALFPTSPILGLVKGGASTLYDLTLEKMGELIQPDGNVTVSVKAPEGVNVERTKVWHIAEDGTITNMNAVYENGYFVFETDHFSYYLVGELNVCPGDIDGDGEVKADDYIMLKRVYFGQATLSDPSLGDITKDGKVNADDYILLKRVYFGQAKLR